jgi:Fe2+ or Zn2+ uptake regulation protein
MTLRITQKRQQILDVLKKQHDTLSAAQLHSLLPEIDLVTIYRNLDLFVKEKLIKQIHLGTDEARFEYQTESHHHAVCTDCEKVIHFTAPDEKIRKLLGLEDFKVDEIEVTVRGVCNPKNRIV